MLLSFYCKFDFFLKRLDEILKIEKTMQWLIETEKEIA